MKLIHAEALSAATLCTLTAQGLSRWQKASVKPLEAPLWGSSFRQAMQDYNFYGRLKMVGEVLPAWNNHVALSDEKDEYGMPMASLLSITAITISNSSIMLLKI